MTSFGALRMRGGERLDARPAARAGRRSASRSRRAARSGRRARRCPRPGRLSIRPWRRERRAAPSARSPGWPGAAATSARVDGSRAPGAAPSRSRRAERVDDPGTAIVIHEHSIVALLSIAARVLPPSPLAGLLLGPARRRGLLVHRAVHPGRGRRPVAAVHRLGPRGGRGRAGRRSRSSLTRQRLPARPAVGAARGRRRRRRRRLPAAHLVRAHHRAGQPRRRRRSRCCRPRPRRWPCCAGTSGRRPSFWVVAGPRRRGRDGVRLGRSGAASATCTGPTCCCSARSLAAAIGYAEGGLLARELGAWQTVSWALVVCAPLMVAAGRRLGRPADAARRTPDAVGGLRLPRRRQHVPRLLRLVPRPGHRADGAGQPGPARPAGADHLLGRPAAGRAAHWTTVVGGLVVIVCAGAAVRVRLGST